MFKQSIGMTESDARQIAEMYLSRYNSTYWDGSGEVPSEANFDICRVAVDSMYEGCTLEIQLCKPDACPSTPPPSICLRAVSGRVLELVASTKQRSATILAQLLLWQALSCVSAQPMRISPIFVRFLSSALLSAKSA